MFRKSLLASAFFIALLPSVAGALGLGGIRTQSALNEPFSAHIDLLDAKAEELDTVKVSLASEPEFNKAGAQRLHFLTKLSFRPQVSSNGRAVILVTSADPVREPFLDFLIEVHWPQGRLVKEYTVLLDPPVTLNRPPPRVEQPAIQRQVSRQAAPSRMPASGARPAQPPASVDATAFPMRHGPVAPGSGLWQIARDMASDTGATVAQTAMALYRNNQGAFIRGDINKLKVNEVLEIPTAAELYALDAGAAEQEFGAALRGGRVTSTPLTDITATPPPKDRLEIAGMPERVPEAQTTQEVPPAQAPPVAEATDGSASEVSAEVPTRIDEGAAAGQTGPALDSIEQNLLLVQEAGESTRQETQELRGRIRELEGQLADIQRLLELSNERFAQLQRGELVNPEGVETAETAESVPEVEVSEEQIVDEQIVEESPQIAAALDPDEAASPTIVSPPAEETVGTKDNEPTSVSAPSFWDSVPQSTLALVLAVPLLLLVLGWMIHRRRKSLEDAWELGDFELASEGAAVATAGVSHEEQATPSAAEFSQVPSTDSGFATLEDEADEDDVISEADVYVAYGRYREAEALLEEEIKKSPDRLDIKFKLADAYYGARNLPAMEALVKQMQGAGVDRINPVQWERLGTMLRDLKSADSEPADSDSMADERPTLQVVEPSQRLESTFPPPFPSGEEQFADVSAPGSTSTEYRRRDSQEQRRKDFDLDVSDLELIGEDVSVPELDETLEMSGGASDLELKLEDLESLEDVDLTSLSDAVPPIESMPTEVLTETLGDSHGASLDITPISKDSDASEFLSSQWQADSGIWDEVATKLDLARAYLEMDDPSAARVILEEVAQEGTEDQRAAAKEMLEQLS